MRWFRGYTERTVRQGCSMTVALEVILFLLVGGLSGFLSGLLGTGGGVVVVPALALIFKYLITSVPKPVIMHVAAGTSLASIIITASMSTYLHYSKYRDVDWSVWWRLLFGGVIGAIAGAWLASCLGSRTLAMVFALVLATIAVHIFIKARGGAEQQQNQVVREASIWLYHLAGFVFGWFSGLLGVGGSVLIVPFMMLMRYPMKTIVATSIAVIVPLSIVGAIAFMVTGSLQSILIPRSTGFVYWPAFFGLSVGSLALVNLGTKASHHANTVLLKRCFAVLLVVVAVEMFVH